MAFASASEKVRWLGKAEILSRASVTVTPGDQYPKYLRDNVPAGFLEYCAMVSIIGFA